MLQYLDDDKLSRLAAYCKSRLVSTYDSATFVPIDDNLIADLTSPHKGFYIGVSDSAGQEVAREGFLKEGLGSVFETANIVGNNLSATLKSKNVTLDKIQTGTLYFTIVLDCVFIADPLAWDENSDGVYFMWGQNHRGLYLPYQIKKMNIPKIEIMDRLCSHEVGVVSSLWKLSESLVWVIKGQSFSI